MTGSIGFQSTLNNSANNFVAALYDTSNVGTVLESIPVPKSGGLYPPDFQVTFTTNLLSGKIYRCILWESADATPSGASRVSGDFKASLNSIKLRSPLYLIADTSTGFASGTNTYTDASLAGWDFWIDINGSGPAFPGSELDYTYDDPSTTITYLLGNWTPGQRVAIFFQPQVSAAPQPPISLISSGIILKVSTTLDSTYKNKAIILQSATETINTPLPVLNSIADFDRMIIYSIGGSHLNAVIPTQGTDKIVWYNGTTNVLTQLILGQNEKLELFKFTDPSTGIAYYWVDGPLPGVMQVGEIFESMSKTGINAILYDGSILSRAIYPRLYAWAQATNAFISTAHWSDTDANGNFINKGFFTQGDGSTTFQIPDLRIYATRRAIDGVTRLPGSFQAEMIGPHSHLQTLFQAVNNGGLKPVGFSGTTGALVNSAYSTATNSGTENRSSNTGIYVLGRI